MTDPKLNRFLALMGATNMSSSEFRAIVREINLTQVEHLVHRFLEMKRSIKSFDKADAQLAFQDDYGQAKRDITHLAQKSEPLTTVAVKRLTSRLRQMDRGIDIPEFKPNLGLSRWLNSLLQVVEPTVVLNAAIAEFSENQSTSDGSWNLSG